MDFPMYCTHCISELFRRTLRISSSRQNNEKRSYKHMCVNAFLLNINLNIKSNKGTLTKQYFISTAIISLHVPNLITA
jgi:hypothetical protein